MHEVALACARDEQLLAGSACPRRPAVISINCMSLAAPRDVFQRLLGGLEQAVCDGEVLSRRHIAECRWLYQGGNLGPLYLAGRRGISCRGAVSAAVTWQGHEGEASAGERSLAGSPSAVQCGQHAPCTTVSHHKFASVFLLLLRYSRHAREAVTH